MESILVITLLTIFCTTFPTLFMIFVFNILPLLVWLPFRGKTNFSSSISQIVTRVIAGFYSDGIFLAIALVIESIVIFIVIRLIIWVLLVFIPVYVASSSREGLIIVLFLFCLILGTLYHHFWSSKEDRKAFFHYFKVEMAINHKVVEAGPALVKKLYEFATGWSIYKPMFESLNLISEEERKNHKSLLTLAKEVILNIF